MSYLLRLLCLVTVTGVVLFAVARLYHVLWWAMCRHAIDPASLSTTTLRGVLDDWSVDYRHVVEKSELVHMVKQFGPLDEQHVKSVQAVDIAALTPDTSFTSGRSFYRAMTSGKHSGVWLVMVANGLDESLAESRALEDTWTSFRKHVTRMGIHRGILDCAQQSNYCEDRGWMTARFLLVIPQNIKDDFYIGRPGSGGASASVIIYVYKGPLLKRSVLTWVEERFQEKIVNIVSLAHLHSKWMTDGARSGPAFRAVFFTDQTTTPAFLSMVSMQYMDMVQFGVIRETDGHLLKWMKEHNVGHTFPQMLILSRDGINYVYGKAVGEYLSPVSLQNFFDMFMPSEMELICCFVVGCFATGMHPSLAASMFHFGVAFVTWWGILVPAKSLLSMALGTPFPFTAPLLTTIPMGSSLLQDLLFYTHHPYLLVICLVFTCFCLDRLMLCVDFVNDSGGRSALCLSDRLHLHTGYLPRSATRTSSRSTEITSVLPAISHPSVASELPFSVENEDNEIENSETSSAHVWNQSVQEIYSDDISERGETGQEDLHQQTASASTTDFISPFFSESDSREGSPAGALGDTEEHEHTVEPTIPANMASVRRIEPRIRRSRDRLRSRSQINVYVADQRVPKRVETPPGADTPVSKGPRAPDSRSGPAHDSAHCDRRGPAEDGLLLGTDTALPRLLRIRDRDRSGSHNAVRMTTGSETTPFTSGIDTNSHTSKPAPSRARLPRNLGSANLSESEDSQNNTLQADYAAEHHPLEEDTTQSNNRAHTSTGAERGVRSADSAAESTPLSAPEDEPEDPVQMRRSLSFLRRRLMRERRMPMLLVERDGQHFLVPFFQRFYPPEGYIDHLPTWEYSAGRERMEATGAASGTSGGEDCITNGCVGATASEQSGIPARRPLQSGFPAGYVDCFVCVICQCEFTNGEKLCGLPCKHVYHYTCIKRWLTEGRHSCPVCRKPAYHH